MPIIRSNLTDVMGPRGRRAEYTRKCGWIDWAHADPDRGDLKAIWSALKAHRAHLESSGELGERRRGRLSREIANLAAERVRFHVEGEAAPALGELVAKAERGEIDPGAAAGELLAKLGLAGA